MYAIRSYYDSRRISTGCLFFGLKGDQFDGSEFGLSAIESGAHFAVVRKGTCEDSPGLVMVEDPLQVLQALAKRHREQFEIPVIGITGSNGKTTTKEFVKRVP